jgi:hypothetical protein
VKETPVNLVTLFSERSDARMDKPDLTLTLETLAVHEVLKADLPLSDLCPALKREVEAVRGLLGRYTVRGVSMDLARRDGGLVNSDMWGLGSKLAYYQFREDALSCGDTVTIAPDSGWTGGLGLNWEVKTGEGEPILCEIGLCPAVWNMDIEDAIDFPSASSEVVVVEKVAGGAMHRSEWVGWLMPKPMGEGEDEGEGEGEDKKEDEEDEKKKMWIWSEERLSFKLDQAGDLVLKMMVPVWYEEEGLELVINWTYRTIRT